MKRWLVNMRAGAVELALMQAPSIIDDEYVVVYVRAVDELGAYVRAKELLKKEQEP